MKIKLKSDDISKPTICYSVFSKMIIFSKGKFALSRRFNKTRSKKIFTDRSKVNSNYWEYLFAVTSLKLKG